jgi:hypothetical protein
LPEPIQDKEITDGILVAEVSGSKKAVPEGAGSPQKSHPGSQQRAHCALEGS